ncbi:hypothetical protein HDU93_001131 [Gonapodya sp. JEL0774]|nr:hypothetical protein HDU93_001131 [Gonapodya sp. JEL0774]
MLFCTVPVTAVPLLTDEEHAHQMRHLKQQLEREELEFQIQATRRRRNRSMSDPDARLDTYAENANKRRRNMRRALSTISIHSQASGSSTGSVHTPENPAPHSDEEGVPVVRQGGVISDEDEESEYDEEGDLDYEDEDAYSDESQDDMSESERQALKDKRKRRDGTSDEDSAEQPRRRRRKNESAFARFEPAPAKLPVHLKVSENLLGLDRLHHVKTPFSTVPLTNLTRHFQTYAFHKEVQTLKTSPTVFKDVMKGGRSTSRSRDMATLASKLKNQQANLDNADEMALVGFKANVLAAHLLQELTDKLDDDQAFPDTLLNEVRARLHDVYDIDINQRPPKKVVKAEPAVPPADGVEPTLAESPAPKLEDEAIDLVWRLAHTILRMQKHTERRRNGLLNTALDVVVLNAMHSSVVTSDITVQKIKNVLRLGDPKDELETHHPRSGTNPVWSGSRPTLADGSYDFSKPIELLAAKDVPLLDSHGRELSVALKKLQSSHSKPFLDSAKGYRGRGKSTRYSYKNRSQYPPYRSGGYKPRGGYGSRGPYYRKPQYDGGSYEIAGGSESSPTPADKSAGLGFRGGRGRSRGRA